MMPVMKRLLILLIVLPALPAAGETRFPAKGSEEQRAVFERGQEEQAKFEERLFLEGGFKRLDDLAAQKRTVRRALFHDPYMMMSFPGIEVERMPDGSVALKMIGPDGESQPTRLPGSAWTTLTGIEGTMFEPKPYVPWDPPAPDEISRPPPICHGWIVRFGSVDTKGKATSSWAECGGEREPQMAFAIEMARLAVSTRSSCKFDAASPFWSFSDCFGPAPVK
jgi:hypothetical protein